MNSAASKIICFAKRRGTLGVRLVTFTAVLATSIFQALAQSTTPDLIPKTNFQSSGLQLSRRTIPGAFLDVLGRKAAVLGNEHRALEAWTYPLQILDRFELSFRIEGYPLEFRGSDIATSLEVRPEATTIIYTHAAFTARQIIFVPVNEPGAVMLLDIDSVLPVSVSVSFRPRLKLMWPAGSMTANVGWSEQDKYFYIIEETGRLAGIIGSPAASEVSVMPYQEEPRDAPNQFRIDVPHATLKHNLVPIFVAGSVNGFGNAKATYQKLLNSCRELYDDNVKHYRRVVNDTTSIHTPDAEMNSAFDWAKIAIDKGLVENPQLGKGLVAGFRTAGESERPGFAWFFGRDSMWTSFATNSLGEFETSRAALDFLKKHQGKDGKIPHEVSQSAAMVQWFKDYPYAWASADATPLYLIAHADYLRGTGDLEYTKSSWNSILSAYRFTRATDTDGNALVENTNVGHGWVEGGDLYPAHEELYLQGLWVEALRSLAEMANEVGDKSLGIESLEMAHKTEVAVEHTFWLPDKRFYAFATSLARTSPRKAEPGPNRSGRQSRMDDLDRSRLIDEDTVMPAVPLWYSVFHDDRAQLQLDHIGSAHIATDWGSRLISDESRLYDPLSYHHGSVWPLFTGWASMGAYRYGRGHVGFHALMSNVSLKKQNALGYITELLSGDFKTAFGRSAHHQIWSEAMIVTPIVRGLLGLDVDRGGCTLRFAPLLPSDWDSIEVKRYEFRSRKFDIALKREPGRLRIKIHPEPVTSLRPCSSGPLSIAVAPAFPLDARIRNVLVNGRSTKFELNETGDVQRAEVRLEAGKNNEVVFALDEGTDVYGAFRSSEPGARSQGLRVLRSRAGRDALRLVAEGLGGRSYSLRVRSPKRVGDAEDVEVETGAGRDTLLRIHFRGTDGQVVRREIDLPLKSSN